MSLYFVDFYNQNNSLKIVIRLTKTAVTMYTVTDPTYYFLRVVCQRQENGS